MKPLTARPQHPFTIFYEPSFSNKRELGIRSISSRSKKVTALLKLRLAGRKARARRRTLVCAASVETSSLRQSRLRTILKHWITTSFGCFVYFHQLSQHVRPTGCRRRRCAPEHSRPHCFCKRPAFSMRQVALCNSNVTFCCAGPKFVAANGIHSRPLARHRFTGYVHFCLLLPSPLTHTNPRVAKENLDPHSQRSNPDFRRCRIRLSTEVCLHLLPLAVHFF